MNATLDWLRDRYELQCEGKGLELRISRAAGDPQVRIEPLVLPQAGMFLWCRLPPGVDAAAVARSCLEEGVVLAPGNSFSQSQSAGDFLRFNVSQCADERVFAVLARAMSRSSAA